MVLFFACTVINCWTEAAWCTQELKPDTMAKGTESEAGEPLFSDIEMMEKYGADIKLAIPALLEGLKSKDAGIRRNAAFALGELGADAEPALNDLARVLQSDPDLEVRRNAAFALGEIGVPSVHLLLNMLNDKDPRMRRNVTASLVRIGQPAVHYLIKLLRDGDPIMRRNAAVILGNIGPKAKDAIPALEKALSDPDKGFCWTVKQALRKIKQISSQDLLDSLHDKDVMVRINTIKELGEIGDKAQGAIPALIACLKDDKTEVRKNAAFALAKIGAPALPSLMEALKSRDGNTRRNAAFSLGEMGSDAAGALPALMQVQQSDPEKNVRMCANIAINKIKGK